MNRTSCLSTELVVAHHRGIEIDHYPRCRGVRLDRDDLDKIVARSGLPDPDHDDDFDAEPGRHHAGDAPSRRRPW